MDFIQFAGLFSMESEFKDSETMTTISQDDYQSCEILLIDDYQATRKLFKLTLSRQYNDSITVATSGLEGIKAAQKLSPDLIILRVMLTGGIDGYEVCRRLKAISHLKQIPVLLFGAIQPQEAYQQAKLCGAKGYLYQPFRPDYLYTARKALLTGKTYFP